MNVNGSSLLKGILVGVIIFCIGLIIATLRFQVLREYEANEAEQVLELVEQNMERTVRDSYTVALTLALTVNEEGEVNNFEEVAKNLLNNYAYIDVLELVPDGVIEYVYPLEGNEEVLGYNILADPRVNAEVLKAAELGTIYFAGPIDLKQGGRAVIGRLPIIIDNEVWGYSAVLIYLKTLIESSGIRGVEHDDYYFQLSKINPNTGEEEFFIENDRNVNFDYTQSVNFPEGDWKLYAKKDGRSQAWTIFWFLIGVFSVGSFLCGYLFYKIFQKPFELEDMLHQRSEELLRSREDFKKNSDLLSSILESPKQMLIFSLDKNYNFIAFNSGQKEIVKNIFDIELKTGMNVFNFLPEENKPVMKKYYDRALAGEHFDMVYESKTDPENIQYWESRFSPIKDKTGEITGLTVFSSNITQKVEAEKKLEQNERRFRTLIENSPFCIHELNREGRLISINQAGLKMMEIENKEEFMGISYDELLPPEQSEDILALFDKALEGETHEFEFSTNGKKFLSGFVPIPNEENEIERVMGITQDITERKKSEEIIYQSLKEKTTLLSEIHHRVKNNLAIVSGLLELQRYEVKDEKVEAAFEQSINRILSIAMVHELMYKSKDLSSISVQNYLEELIPTISSTMQDESLNVEFDIQIDDTKLNISEAIPLGLMFNELITNSFKYAFEPGSDAKISIQLDKTDHNIKVVYQDNGKGFKDSANFDKPKNLGLNLVHTQLQQLDSKYSADTKNGFRLEFTFKQTD